MRVQSVQSVTSQKTGRQYWRVKFEDQSEYITFSQQDASALRVAAEQGTPVSFSVNGDRIVAGSVKPLGGQAQEQSARPRTRSQSQGQGWSWPLSEDALFRIAAAWVLAQAGTLEFNQANLDRLVGFFKTGSWPASSRLPQAAPDPGPQSDPFAALQEA